VKKTDKEVKRTPNAAVWNNRPLTRVDLTGVIRLQNFRAQAVELEIMRQVLGQADTADNDGQMEMINLLEDDEGVAAQSIPAWWWNDYGTLGGLNGVGRIRWKIKLEPGKTAELGYGWHYHR
jgi:hypothetical protein